VASWLVRSPPDQAVRVRALVGETGISYDLMGHLARKQTLPSFKVEKLLINGSLYRGPETALFPLYGCLMNG